MGIFNKNRKDAKWIKPKDGIAAIMPYIMNKRADAEVSSQLLIDVTNLCNFVDKQNESGKLDYKMTYFHAITAILGITIYNREALNRFVKNKRLYQRNKITFAFVAKDKMSDNAEEKLICLELDPNETGLELCHKMAIDIFKVKKEGTNNMNDILNFFTSLPKWLLEVIVGFVKILDKHGLSPKAITEGDTNHATVILSNLGSIGTSSCYHHLTDYGTNSIVITIGTIRKEEGKKVVDICATIDERIADGFYFAKSMQLFEYIAKNPELLKEKLSQKIEINK